jgi:MYXO-CTERM domain-containing protein
LEPDNVSQWSGTLLGQAMVATAARLQAAGYTPRFIAPSNTNMGNAVTYFDQLAAVPGALTHLEELSYHRYGGVSAANLQALVSRADQNGLKTAMLEWWSGGNTIDVFLDDLINGKNSAIQQATIAGPNAQPNDFSLYSMDITNPASPQLSMTNPTRLRRQYYKWVRMGAQRIGAGSSDPAFVPAAFVNTNGSRVVVVKGDTAGTVEVQGLPAGTYHINYSTLTDFDHQLPDVDLREGGVVAGALPGAGVITFYGDGTMGSGGGGAGGAGGGGATGAGGGGAGGAGTGASSGADGGGEGGCGCRAAGGGNGGSFAALVLVALAAAARRRRAA